MSGGAGMCGEDSNFSLTQGNLTLQRDRVLSKTCMRGFMTKNGWVCPNAADVDGKDGWGSL